MTGVAASGLRWQWTAFAGLSGAELYVLLALREAVFVVEQRCAYQELDGLDQDALHLIAWEGGQAGACLRLLAPGVKRAGPVIGRVLTRADLRGRGLGGELMRRGAGRGRRCISARRRICRISTPAWASPPFPTLTMKTAFPTSTCAATVRR